MILKENNTRAIINKHNRWVYILADTTGTEFVEKELGYKDPSELPTTYIDDNMFFTFSPDMDEYAAAWQYAKNAKVEDFNKTAEKTLKDAGYKVWEDIKPRVDEYIATVEASITTTGNYVYNLIDELVEPFRWTDCDSIGEDYYLNMLYSYPPFFNKLDDTIHEDLDESTMNRKELYDYDYGCDCCGTRVPEKKITWYYGASVGLCPECRNNYTKDELHNIDVTGELPESTCAANMVCQDSSDLKESNDEDVAWAETEIKTALDNLTQGFTKFRGSVETEYEDEASMAKRILKQYYKSVEGSDARRNSNDSPSWRIDYSMPLSK
jgi:hypothetical protein